MKYLICALHEYPSIAIFLTIAIGFWLASLRLCSFRLGSEWGTLIALLLLLLATLSGRSFCPQWRATDYRRPQPVSCRQRRLVVAACS
jgi:hypothetical protein